MPQDCPGGPWGNPTLAEVLKYCDKVYMVPLKNGPDDLVTTFY